MIATIEKSETLPTHFQTVDEFEQWQQQPGNDGNFEFVRGQIIPKSMKQNEVLLGNFLLRQFIQTKAFQQGDILMAESDSYVDGNRKRIPDLTYFSEKQLKAIRQGERVKTRFAIEILSDSESYEDVVDKIQDYFDGGAQLVWYIVPNRQRIDAYTSPETLKVYNAKDVISAAPVVPDMQFTVADMFV